MLQGAGLVDAMHHDGHELALRQGTRESASEQSAHTFARKHRRKGWPSWDVVRAGVCEGANGQASGKGARHVLLYPRCRNNSLMLHDSQFAQPVNHAAALQ